MSNITLTRPFWREEPFTQAEAQLLELVLAAHAASTRRPNVSTVTLINAFAGSGRLPTALAAALCTLGGPHGPIEETVDVLLHPDPADLVVQTLAAGRRVPGWGNSFHRGQPDPEWRAVDECLKNQHPYYWRRLETLTDYLDRAGKKVFPNPSAYTAATALVLGLPRELAPFLFILGRLPGWAALLLAPAGTNGEQQKGTK